MSTILVTNDDGVRSDGIHALAAALAPLGQVTVVAPMTEASVWVLEQVAHCRKTQAGSATLEYLDRQ